MKAKFHPGIAALLALAIISTALASPYSGITTPDTGDNDHASLQKINKILDDQKTGTSNNGSPSWASGQVTGAASPVLIAARATRRGITVRDTDATLSIYIGPTVGVNASTGMLLKAGESISLDTAAAVYVYAASGSPVVGYVETYN